MKHYYAKWAAAEVISDLHESKNLLRDAYIIGTTLSQSNTTADGSSHIHYRQLDPPGFGISGIGFTLSPQGDLFGKHFQRGTGFVLKQAVRTQLKSVKDTPLHAFCYICLHHTQSPHQAQVAQPLRPFRRLPSSM